MRLLLDAHTLIWSVDDPSKLAQGAAEVLRHESNDLLLSAGTLWEISIKVGLGKLELSLPFAEWMNRAIADLGVAPLQISILHAEAQMRLPPHHGDPFDRLWVGQALVEEVPIVSGDSIFDKYGVTRIWKEQVRREA
jgi:PIN domain nuclease of toxin-antitoxin system